MSDAESKNRGANSRHGIRATEIPGLLFACIVAIPLYILIFILTLPWTVLAWRDDRRYWQRLQERGQVTTWSEVEPQLARGTGTLVVEWGPKGPTCAWWIDAPRAEVDPHGVVPSWRDWEAHWGRAETGEHRELFTPEHDQRIEDWAAERLATYQSSAKAVPLTRPALKQLRAGAGGGAVLLMLCWTSGALSELCGGEGQRSDEGSAPPAN